VSWSGGGGGGFGFGVVFVWSGGGGGGLVCAFDLVRLGVVVPGFGFGTRSVFMLGVWDVSRS
jgi:hypothetical protein